MKFLIGSIEETTAKNKKPFMKVSAVGEDKVPTLLYVWEDLEAFKDTAAKCKVMEIVTDGNEQFPKVTSFAPTAADPAGFVNTAYPTDEYALDLLNKLLDNITHPTFVELNKKIFTPEVKLQFVRASAAHGQHHAIHGGLILHTYEVMQFVSAICNSRLGSKLNKEVALEGALLHDIGKLDDYITADEATFDYSAAFYTSSHLSRGAELVSNLGNTEDPDIQHVMHIIRSHHLQIEWGAVCKPATEEAYLVFLGDYFSMVHNKAEAANYADNGVGKVPGTRDVFLDFYRMFKVEE